MKRRNFLKNIAKVSAAPLLINGQPLHSFATPSMLSLRSCQEVNERVLVLVFLKGGNDGLNTIIPVEQYAAYANLRPTLRIKDTGTNAYIPLDATLTSSDQVGLHPALTSFKALYDAGHSNIIQGVGYPQYNQSHFKSRDLWLSAGDGTPEKFNILSGWMGRYIETAFPGIAGMPNSLYPDPLGIQLGDTKPSLGLHSHAQEYVGTNLSGQDPANLAGLLNGLGTATHEQLISSEYGEELAHIMSVENSTNAYGQRITEIYNAGTNSSITYPYSDLAEQLRMVARMIAGGSKTKIYLVHKNGFDNHSGQIALGASHLGNHATHLADVFDSIKAFQDDLTNLGLADRVLTSTFSEFGRRVVENGSLGTDHGNLSNMFIIGKGVKAGVIGTNLDLTNLLPSGNFDPAAMQVDYRSVFKTLLQDWLGADDAVVNDAMVGAYSSVPNLINPTFKVDPSCYLPPVDTCLCTDETIVLNDQTIPDGTMHKAADWIETNGTIAANTTVALSAANQIALNAGFTAEAGSELSLSIDECAQPSTLVESEEVAIHTRLKNKIVPIEPTSTSLSAKKQDVAIQRLLAYPNPVQQELTVLYKLVETEEISISLFTLDGKLMELLVDHQKKEKGEWQLQINCTALPAGIYIIELATRQSIDFQKITVID